MKLHERLIAMFFVFAATSFAAEPSLVDEKVRQLAAERVKAGAYPTLVIGVIRGGKQQVVTFGGATENTIYEIGSVTKTFTALLLADAVQHGEVSLDDPVQKLLPDFTIPREGDHQITLLDLATQSSGLPRLPDNLLPKDAANPYADYTPAKLKTFLAAYKLPRVPGATYEYSNLGFGLLGHALATRAHLSYAELVTRRITAPLGMKDTGVAVSTDAAKRVAAGNPIARWDFDALAGAGALKSTAHDMLIYVGAMMKGGPAALATTPRRATESAARRIGLAWMTEARGGRDVVWHNGMTGGYASFVGFTADGERGVVVLTNSSHDVSDLGMLALTPETMTPPAKEIALTAKAAAAYAGRYRLAPGFDLVVRADGNQLRAAATGQAELPLFASAEDEFFYKAVDARISFRRDTTGKVTSLVLHQNGNDMPALRVESEAPAAAERKEIALDAAALQVFVGRYPLAPGFALEVTAEKGQLYVQATAQPRIPVYASAPNEFFYKVVDAQLTFERDAAAKVVAVVLHQNGQHIRGAKEPRQ
jgi:D-alanyl-D-alanine-carboxypeptidase/D-alanyl-D-alanine-endopeptidase